MGTTVDLSTLVTAFLGAGGISAAIGVWWKNKVESEKQRMQHELDLKTMQTNEHQKTLEIVKETMNGKTVAIHELLGKIAENQARVVELQVDTAKSVGRIAATLEARPCLMGVEKPNESVQKQTQTA